MTKKIIKKLFLLSIAFSQILNWSCGASLISRIQDNDKNISSIKNITYDDYSLAFKDVYVNRKTDTISGTLYYVPNYTINAELETSYTKRINAFGIGLLVNFIFLSMASVSKLQSKDASQGFTATDMLSLSLLGDVAIASWEIYSLKQKELEEDNNKKEIPINESKNFRFLTNKKVLETLTKELHPEKLQNVSINLDSDCEKTKNPYTLKINSDSTFSLPYNVFKNSVICSFDFDSNLNILKMKNDYYFEDVERNLFSDEIIYKYF